MRISFDKTGLRYDSTQSEPAGENAQEIRAPVPLLTSCKKGSRPPSVSRPEGSGDLRSRFRVEDSSALNQLTLRGGRLLHAALALELGRHLVGDLLKGGGLRAADLGEAAVTVHDVLGHIVRVHGFRGDADILADNGRALA